MSFISLGGLNGHMTTTMDVGWKPTEVKSQHQKKWWFFISTSTIESNIKERILQRSKHNSVLILEPVTSHFKKYFNSYYLVQSPSNKQRVFHCFACQNPNLPSSEKESIPSSLEQYKKRSKPNYDNRAARAADLKEVLETLERYRQQLYRELQAHAKLLNVEDSEFEELTRHNSQLEYIARTMEKLKGELAELEWFVGDENAS